MMIARGSLRRADMAPEPGTPDRTAASATAPPGSTTIFKCAKAAAIACCTASSVTRRPDTARRSLIGQVSTPGSGGSGASQMVVAPVTRACQWRISDLVEGDRPVTLYLVVPPSDISRTKPLIRLILNQIGRRLTEELTPKGNRHRVLLMLDEFPALGRLDFFDRNGARHGVFVEAEQAS